MILGWIDEAVRDGAAKQKACEVVGISRRTLQRWRRQGIGDDNRAGPRKKPKNALTEQEQANVLKILTSQEFRDKSPWQIVPVLADRGKYVASESTMYRLLRKADMQKHREPTREAHKRHRPDEFKATAPNQVWSWDITYLASEVRGAFFYLYMVVDIFSRKITADAVFESESGGHAADVLGEACHLEGVTKDQLVIHSDNGGPMKSATLIATLQSLGVANSYSRPMVSNDNAYSESLFRTVKCRPEYPRQPFKSLEDARCWVAQFVSWYNTEHLHSGIGFVTPKMRHQGLDREMLVKRRQVYAAARAENPDRWSGETRQWKYVEDVILNRGPELAR